MAPQCIGQGSRHRWVLPSPHHVNPQT